MIEDEQRSHAVSLPCRQCRQRSTPAATEHEQFSTSNNNSIFNEKKRSELTDAITNPCERLAVLN